MHILHVAPYYAPAWGYGGVVSAVSGLATAQAALGQRVSVLTTDALTPMSRIETRREVIEGVNVIRCRNAFPILRRLNLSSPIGMRRALNELQADVIHVHEFRTVENLIVAAASHVPLIVSPHGTLPRETGRSIIKTTWDRLFGQMLAQRFAGVAALTEDEAQDVRILWESFGVNPPRIEVIPNGVTISEASTPTDEPIVLFLGRLHERKGLQFLIPAFAQAAVAGSRLMIVGPDEGMLALAQRLVSENGIADRVTFTGLLTGKARDDMLRRAALFVLPAVGEGLSMAALEAMAAGLPVILTPGCNLPEAETRGVGLIVAREVEPQAAAIRALLTDPARRVSMGAAGRAWMQADYSWPSVAARMIKFYENVHLLSR